MTAEETYRLSLPSPKWSGEKDRQRQNLWNAASEYFMNEIRYLH